MPDIELTNMVMICNKEKNEVIVQNRIKSWCGLTFPGGHVENNESFLNSAIREVKEETGLDIRNLIPCGIIHWSSRTTFDRYLVFLYKTYNYSGNLIGETYEGQVFWMEIDKLLKAENLSNEFDKYLPIFLGDIYTEAFVEWDG